MTVGAVAVAADMILSIADPHSLTGTTLLARYRVELTLRSLVAAFTANFGDTFCAPENDG